MLLLQVLLSRSDSCRLLFLTFPDQRRSFNGWRTQNVRSTSAVPSTNGFSLISFIHRARSFKFHVCFGSALCPRCRYEFPSWLVSCA